MTVRAAKSGHAASHRLLPAGRESVAAHHDAPSSSDSIIPIAPAPPGPANQFGAVLWQGTGGWTVAAGSYVYAHNLNRSLLSVYSDNGDVVNHGQIFSIADEDLPGSQLELVNSFRFYGSLVNTGTIVFEGPASVLLMQGVSSVNNSGTIILTAHGLGVTGINTSGELVGITNSGIFAASATHGQAIAISTGQGGPIVNTSTGYILAEAATDAFGVELGPSYSYDTQWYLDNAGWIEARTFSDEHIAIGVWLYDSSVRNSGVIRGDVAIYGYGKIENSGTLDGIVAVYSDEGINLDNKADGKIYGDIISDGVAWIDNAGLIDGNVSLSDRDDRFVNTGSGYVVGYVDLGKGNDYYAGSNQSDWAYGADGDDVFLGGAGDDLFYGEGGKDRFAPGSGDDLIDGGDELDFVDYSDATGAIALDLSNGTASGATIGTDELTSIESARGGSGDDLMIAGSSPYAWNANVADGSALINNSRDKALSLDGQFGLGANAYIADSTTVPHVTVFATGGGDINYYSFQAGAGSKLTIDTDGSTIYTFLQLYDSNGVELVSAEHNPGNDPGTTSGLDLILNYTLANAGTYYFRIVSVPPNATDVGINIPVGKTYTLHVSLTGAPVIAAITGSQLEGDAGNDTLIGSAGNDLLDGGTGSDKLYGGAGDDAYGVDSATDLVFENAGGGTDTVTASAGYYLHANVENLRLASQAGDIFGVGNELANIITGNEGSNLLIAGAGDDVVHGGSGVDSLFGQDGADQLFGDAGVDYLVAGIGNDMLDGGADADALYGEDGDDTLIGGSDFKTDILVGGNGNDTLRGDSGLADYDLMDGGAGNDAYYVDTGDDLTFEAVGGGNDTVYANVAGANNGVYLYANVENLVLLNTTTFGVGNELANTMTGSASGNWLLGGAGNDTLNGKAGNDVLFGEGGSDTFVFEHGTGGDVIGDFTVGSDKIDLSAFGLSWQTVLNSMHDNGGTTAIDLGNGDLIVLNGVASASLGAGDFILTAGSSARAAPWDDFADAGATIDAVVFAPVTWADFVHTQIWHGAAAMDVPFL